MPTLRQEILEALVKEPFSLRELSKLFGLQEREVLGHLAHIARSAHPRRLVMEPAVCNRCGFIFKKRERLSRPSRCPLCKEESITPPRYRISA